MSTAEITRLAGQLASQANSAEFGLDLAVGQVAMQQGLSLDQEQQLRDSARKASIGFGKLQPYLDDESIEEVWINRPNEIYFARAGIVGREFLAFNANEIAGLVERMLRSTGRRLDRSSPFVDAALPDGSRLHVVIPDISRQHWSVNIRKFPSKVWTLADLVLRSVITDAQAQLLANEIARGGNILVSGATQAGKTTLLCALIEQTAAQTRMVSVEETFEIRSTKADWVALQTRQANLEGRGEVSLRRLVKESLRMRPSLLVVGEVREAESLDLLIAMNSGIPGMCTIHANSAAEAITKLCTLPLLAGANISADFVSKTVLGCIDLVVHCKQHADGSRKVEQIARVVQTSSGVTTQLIQVEEFSAVHAF